VSHWDKKRQASSFSVEKIIRSLDCQTDEQKVVADKLVKKVKENEDAIRVPRGMSEDRMREILQSAVNLLAVDWNEVREEKKMYMDALPLLQKTGLINEAPVPTAFAVTERDIVGKRESANDCARAVKQAVSMKWESGEPPPELSPWFVGQYARHVPTEEANHGLVADILNAYFEPYTVWDFDRVSKL
jgi:hypothetical protein